VNRQIDEQAHIKVDKQTDRWAERHADRQEAHIHTERCTDRERRYSLETCRPSNTQTNKQRRRHLQTERQLTNRETIMQTDRQMDGKTGR